jgi:hypothetical protein
MMTGAGVILGTAAYMSPEQARGRPVDKRADIWAFGCVLYEMLCGERTFGAPEITDTVALIITKEPEWNALPPQTPGAVRRLLRRCLEKDRQSRLRDIADAGLEIDDSLSSTAERAVAPPALVAWRRVTLGTVAGLIVGAVSVWLVVRDRMPTPPVTAGAVADGHRLVSRRSIGNGLGPTSTCDCT